MLKPAPTTLTESIAIASVKLTPTALNRLLDDMDNSSIIPPVENRTNGRVCCRWTAIVVVVNQNGYESTFLIPVRDISTTGIAFLHRSMLHKDTPCTIRFRTPNHKWLQMEGKVVRSRYVRDMIYEIGLKFREPVSAEQFDWISQRVKARAGHKAKSIANDNNGQHSHPTICRSVSRRSRHIG